jgi:outer membrane protein
MLMRSLLAAGALAALAGGAAAQSHSFYIGGIYIDVHSKAPPLSNSPVPNAEVEVDDSSTVGIGYVYRFDPAWSVEGALGIPPKHKTYGRGFLEPFGQISSMKQIAPTVFVNYHFEPMAGKWQPFVGAGINYTHFIEGHSTASGDAASGGPTTIKLKDSWGPAAHVGMTYAIDKQWSLVGTIAAAKVKSDVTATTTTATGTVVRTTTIDFRPVAYTLSVGYSF